VTSRLVSLVRKELIRPERPLLPPDDAFRFGHLLHERFAGWLEERGVELVEQDEIVGYHLEQAVLYKDELGQRDDILAERAGERLAAAGRRALRRGDERAALSLLARALELTRPIRLDVHLEVDLVDTLRRTKPLEGAAVADGAADRAREAGDETAEALARVVAAELRSWADPGASIDHLEALVRSALPLLEQAEDHVGLAYVWYALGFSVANSRARMEEHAYASERALHHARLAGRPRNDLFHLDGALAFGPRPADVALQALDAVLPAVPNPHSLLARAYLLAMLGRFGEAWAVAREQTERLRELQGSGHEAWVAWIAQFEGDDERAAREFRSYCDELEKHGQFGGLSTFAPCLGRSLCALGRYDEAEPLAQLGRRLGNEQDLYTQMLWRQVQALVHAHRGEHAKAEALARGAVSISERTDTLSAQADAFCDLAEVLASAGRTNEAAEALERALDRYERKKNLAMVAQVRPRLEKLRAAVS
jgi:tetratricopeptide (TPR) repeat protein